MIARAFDGHNYEYTRKPWHGTNEPLLVYIGNFQQYNGMKQVKGSRIIMYNINIM